MKKVKEVLKKVTKKPKKVIKERVKRRSITQEILNPTIGNPEGIDYWRDRSLDDKRRDWYYQGKNWIEDYAMSIGHEHRKIIINALEKLEPFAGVFEAGCNSGPNLYNIQRVYPETQMAGVDVNGQAIDLAKSIVPGAILKVGSVTNIPFGSKEFDVVISDAVLIYISPEEIEKAMNELDRIARKAIILCEWGDESLQGVIKDGHWARNYGKLLEKMGYKVETIKITEETWPNKSGNWARNGYVFVAVRQ